MAKRKNRQTSPAPSQTTAGVAAPAATPDHLLSLHLLKRAIEAVNRTHYATAIDLIQQSLRLNNSNATAWTILAVSYDAQEQWEEAFEAYETAARLTPDDASIMRKVAALALKLGHKDVAKRLLEGFLARHPDDVDVSVQLVTILRDQHFYGDATDRLRGLIQNDPANADLWNLLGSVVEYSGDAAGSRVFYEEAIRLAPDFLRARRNLATCLMMQNNSECALEELDAALARATQPFDVAALNIAKAVNQFILGDLSGGFESYESRLEGVEPKVRFKEFGKRWGVDDDLGGKTLLVYGELGIGDEVLFASILNEVIEALGRDGRLYLAVEPRLVSLFQRSFPSAVVGPYEVERSLATLTKSAVLDDPASGIDFWVPLISLCQRFRRTLADFPRSNVFLVPDPERVAFWRAQLKASGEGPYVGLVWKSINISGGRLRQYAPFELWQPILANPSVRFINLQYGDITGERALAKTWGAELWTPPGLDLKMDIEDLTALCAALDLVIGPSTATSNFAAAAGTQVWLSAGPGWWTCFGTDYAPAYPRARVFRTAGFDQWDRVTEAMAMALEEQFSAAQRPEPVAV